MATSTATAAPRNYKLGPQPQNVKGRTLIAHISDLHFTSSTDPEKEEVWSVLATDLRRRKVDLLVVTGDLIDSSISDNLNGDGIKNAFINVKSFLTSLCGDIGIEDPQSGLTVVPGNHDYRIKGILSPDSRFDVVRRMKQRFVTPHYDLFFEQFREYYLPKFLPNLHCCLFTFDSNTTDLALNLASGRITNNDLAVFLNLCQSLPAAYPDEWSKCTKIALLHHHPMPIAATELRGGFIESEAYHLLKNAGLFMTEMVNQNVDLILHGHKHYPAFSRATFPVGEENSHTVSVVAAGSASIKGLPHTSYNLITIYDNGKVSVERRVREETVAYRRGLWMPSLQSYEETRRNWFRRLAENKGLRVSVRKYMRVDVIKPGSGDDEIMEEYNGVTSYTGEPLNRFSFRYTSRSGFVSKQEPEPKSENQSVWWQEDKSVPGQGWTNFDPPLSDRQISFNCRTTIHNAIHFNKQDRLATTGNVVEESSYATITDLYELFTLKVRFPLNFTPRYPKVHVLDQTFARDYAEEEYAASRFTNFSDDNTAVLIVDRPLPGYTYKIIWGLPDNEDEELNLGDADRLKIDGIMELLLKLRKEGGEREAQGRAALAALKSSINDATANSQHIGATDLEIALHVQDRTQGGLVCVAALSSSAAEGRLFNRVIPVGDNIIGQVHRRREHIKWIRGQNKGRDAANFLDYDQEQPHTGILSVPLFYPVDAGGRVGVLTLATRGNMMPILELLEEDLTDENEAAFRLLVSIAHTWYANQLMVALGLPPLAVATPVASGGN